MNPKVRGTQIKNPSIQKSKIGEQAVWKEQAEVSKTVSKVWRQETGQTLRNETKADHTQRILNQI